MEKRRSMVNIWWHNIDRRILESTCVETRPRVTDIDEERNYIYKETGSTDCINAISKDERMENRHIDGNELRQVLVSRNNIGSGRKEEKSSVN